MAENRLSEMTFPNGLRLFCLPMAQAETRFVYWEIFEDELYTRHGVTIRDGDCILDVGANIGMFAVFAMRKWKNLQIHAFEPVPPTFEVLQANVARTQLENPGTVHLHQSGVSNEHGFHEVTFYPRSPANSTLFPDEKQKEPAVTVGAISVRDVWNYDKWGSVILLLLYPFRRRLIQLRMRRLFGKGVTYRSEFIPLSAIIEQHGLETIDLLKVDVEGSECRVLEGISEPHWERIKQLVVEVSPANVPRIGDIRESLAAKGFRNIALESMGDNAYQEGSRLPCNIYATR